ncbi:helix-turn-helix domain-containing protein [Ralstonia pickettii]|jgi:transcriptional regulator with XRE-family HTH domain|uniref:helix-turn-helix domain-containing protein n=1 Tax=Ralstonia pickettii TaxID=329 RepID=UPI00066D81B8|nr:helix-turn-helix transcriptional regulator [Ralstonia pickettii]MBB0025879.1 XRE family transcriptional regulator [Ralstonia pickettii]MBB0036762.1 XRE family transcriptional regulator [Ralstonia pickettii]MBB0099207.1 XRE family transcriptional regulator [Ralstonia pickettii]MBB0109097.1 XRE family transcriptional regulator [Ralstonia pickettii]MBB0130076.1 XRE family transcriptional regulator [Ralstonia pickettii]
MPRVSFKTDKDGQLALLGAAVRARRKAALLSQEALADRAEIDRSHMGKIERGERNVTLLNVLRIAQALDCKPSELLAEAGL